MSSRLRSIVVKELLSMLRDPRARMALIVPPLLQLAVFSFAATLEVRNVGVAVLDDDGGVVARELSQRVAAASFVDELVTVSGLAELEERLVRQDVLMALHFAPGLSRDVAAGRPGRVQVLLDGRRANASQIALGYLRNIVAGLPVELAGGAPGAATPGTVVRNWFNPNLIYVWYIVPSLSGILAMFVSLIVTSLSIARERELGTFDQLVVSPATTAEIVVGKTLPAVIVGSVLGLVMIAAGVFAFRIPFTGSFVLLLGSLVLFIASIVGIGLVISSVCRTQQQAILGTFSVGVPAVLISGFATPVENMPAALQLVAELSPLKHYLVIVQRSFLAALPAAEVLANAWPMAAIAAVTFPAAALFVQRRLP